MFVVGGGEIVSSEGTTQGDPMGMAVSYRVGLRAQANFSAQTFKPAHKSRAGQRTAP